MKTSTERIVEVLIVRYPELKSLRKDILLTVNMIINMYNQDGKLLVCGNGGSASDSLHIVGELMKNFSISRGLNEEFKQKIFESLDKNDANYLAKNLQESIQAISLVSETAFITAYSNDDNPELIFAQQVYGYGRKEDILFAISTSGNSSNVINAAKIAKLKNIKVVSLTGNDGGKLKLLSDININVNNTKTYEIQEYHLPIYHTICMAVENELFGSEK